MAVDGLAEALAALDGISARVASAAVEIVRKGQATVEAAAKRGFTNAHARGSPTPSAPGTPPAVITGTLRRSILSDPPRVSGVTVEGLVYPTVVYARIQELGGVTGRGHHTTLPPRPYMRPAQAASLDAIHGIAVAEWTTAIKI